MPHSAQGANPAPPFGTASGKAGRRGPAPLLTDRGKGEAEAASALTGTPLGGGRNGEEAAIPLPPARRGRARRARGKRRTPQRTPRCPLLFPPSGRFARPYERRARGRPRGTADAAAAAREGDGERLQRSVSGCSRDRAATPKGKTRGFPNEHSAPLRRSCEARTDGKTPQCRRAPSSTEPPAATTHHTSTRRVTAFRALSRDCGWL